MYEEKAQELLSPPITGKGSILLLVSFGIVIWPIVLGLVLLSEFSILSQQVAARGIVAVWALGFFIWGGIIQHYQNKEMEYYTLVWGSWIGGMFIILALSLISVFTPLLQDVQPYILYHAWFLLLVSSYAGTALFGQNYGLSYAEYILYSVSAVLSAVAFGIWYLNQNPLLFVVFIALLQLIPPSVASLVSEVSEEDYSSKESSDADRDQ